MSKARELADVIGTQDTTENVLQGRRNLIINGAMQVAQRGTSFTGISAAGAYGADRWNFYNADSTGALTISNSSNAPSNFSNSTRVEVTTANASIGAGSFGHFYYAHEGQDLQQLGFGASGAKQFTVSFWCRTNVPATYQWNVYNTDSTVMEGHTFTVNSSATWEYKTLTFSADTTNGINNDTGDSFRHLVLLYAGSTFSSGSTPTTWTSHSTTGRGAGLSNKTAFIGTVGNYFEITGVQLEVGSVATPFEHRSYGEELALCQRYFTIVLSQNEGAGMVGACDSSTYVRGFPYFPVTMRATPTLVESDTGIIYRFNGAVNANNDSTPPGIDLMDVYGGSMAFTGFSGLSAGQGGAIRINNASSPSGSYVAFDAEL